MTARRARFGKANAVVTIDPLGHSQPRVSHLSIEKAEIALRMLDLVAGRMIAWFAPADVASPDVQDVGLQRGATVEAYSRRADLQYVVAVASQNHRGTHSA